MATNQELAQMFADIADAMEVLGENRFRVNAYRKAADTLKTLTVGVATLRQEQDLTTLPNIGQASAQMINEVLDQGFSPLYEAMLTRVPPGLLELLRVEGIGPKKAASLYHEHGIADRAQLHAAAAEGRLRAIKGFGAATEQRILAGLNARLAHTPRLRLDAALRAASELCAACASLPGVSAVEPVGSLRRRMATVGDLNIALAADDPAAVRAAIAALPHVASLEESAPDAPLTITLHNGMRASLTVATPTNWGATLLWHTGSRAHVAALSALAEAQGLTLGPQGLARDGAPLPAESEDALYAALGLAPVPPELREDWGEIAAAQAQTLPALVTVADLRADLHWHTTWSDGKGELAAMVAAGLARGYSHMAVADHSAYLGVTGGLDAKRLREQRAAIDALNAELRAQGVAFTLLQCCEVDILPDGTLALDDATLAALDLVVASPHVALRQERALATARLIRAIENPHVDIIGHPTGRLLEERPGADIDLEAVIAAAARTGVALEVNAGPERLDLDGAAVRQAIAAGVKIAIDTDAHDPAHLAGIGLGVATARRGWATPADVINTWSLEALLAWAGRAR